MDSTTSDHPRQPSQSQQPPQQAVPIHNPLQAPTTQFPIDAYYPPQPYSYATAPLTPYYPAGPAWPYVQPMASYTPQQSNVPQYRPAAPDRVQNHSMAQGAVTYPQKPTQKRTRVLAELRHPDTKDIVPLTDETNDTKKSPDSSQNTTRDTTTATTVGQELLAKVVAIDNNESSKENKMANNKKSSAHVNEPKKSSKEGSQAASTVPISNTVVPKETKPNVPQAVIKDGKQSVENKVECATKDQNNSAGLSDQQESEHVTSKTNPEANSANNESNGAAKSDKKIEKNASEAVCETLDVRTSIPTEEPDDVQSENESNEEDKVQKEEDPLAQLEYDPDQFHPVKNRDGKRHYSIDFLREIGEKKFNALQLNNDSNYENNVNEFYNNRSDFFAPAYSRPTVGRTNDSSRRSNQQNYNGRSSSGQDRPRKIIPASASLTQEVELKTTSNPWKPSKESKEDEIETLKRKFRSILNKLTPDNFSSLAERVSDLNIDTEPKLADVIDIVFAKALAEPGYCVLYGQMCSHLKKITIASNTNSNTNNPASTNNSTNFGNTLLRRCQIQFNTDIYNGLDLAGREEKIQNETDPEVKKQLTVELYEDKYRCRMRGLGLIKFIGELYKIDMLNYKIMMDCIGRLLSDASDETLECLCDLLTTIGGKLEHDHTVSKERAKEKGKSNAKAYAGGVKTAASVVAGSASTPQPDHSEHSLDDVFKKLHKLRKENPDLSTRIKFKILDTCELREKHNWEPKNRKANDPQKIDEIREEHQKKLEQERRQVGPRRSQEGNRRGLGQAGGSSGHISSMANDGRGSHMHTSASSHQIMDHPNDSRANQQDFAQKRDLFVQKLSGMSKTQTDSTEKTSLRPQSFGMRNKTTTQGEK